MAQPTTQEALAELYGYDQDAHFDTDQLREGHHAPRIGRVSPWAREHGDPVVMASS
ncbi:hypothetical protein ACFWWM_17245 [Streptomyces sp. NPDC058682]|uniref:hypothetical protein n=1 Tax=unclassified Streptomyces TaxID=2593676 RepID=UPI00225BFEBB|nr:hypothetical protein [Streptomyces sp. NBC_01214]MCX4804323.1 hypothetical protein [Streptomyces sp. NBC_01214]